MPPEKVHGAPLKEIKKGLEFNLDDYLEIDKYCKEKSIDWFASAWDINSLKFLDQFDLKYHKIASAMITDKKFLEEVAKRKIHTFISTGMSTTENIRDAVEIFNQHNCKYELMHCIYLSNETKDANLATINQLKESLIVMWVMGHENGIAISIGIYVWHNLSERHITLDRTMYGSDQAASLE